MKWWSLFLFSLLLISCAGGRGMKGIKCMKPKPRKVKKYRVKKMKPVYRPIYSASSGGSSSNKSSTDNPSENTDSTEQITASVPIINSTEITEPIPVETVTQEPVIAKEIKEEVTMTNRSVAVTPLTAKTVEQATEQSTPQVFLTFREQEINISDGYSFNEIIPFVINRDRLLNPDEAYGKLEDLSNLLKNNPQVQVTIIANTATDEPHPSHRYGGDEETLTTMRENDTDSLDENGINFSLKKLMMARNQRIEQLLIENGVNAEQLDYQLGRHNMWKYQRYVTFVLKEKE